MRTQVAPLVLAGLYLFAGGGILAALGRLPATTRAAVPFVGLGYVTGVAAILLVSVWLTCAGVEVNVPILLAIAAIIGVSGLAIAFRRRSWPSSPGWTVPRPRSWSAENWYVAATAAGLAALGVVGYLHAWALPLNGWDSWAIWALKARAFFDGAGLDSEVFTSSQYAFAHPDYPIALPLFESFWFRVVGSPDTQTLHSQFWLLFAASLGALAHLGARIARPALWISIVALVAIAPAARGQLLSGYADMPMALFLALGALLVGLWIAQGQRSDLALGTLMLAVAANLKNEGLVAAGVVVLALAVVRWGRPALLAAVGAALAVLPWRLWLAANDISGDMPIGRGLSPGYLLDRTERVWPAIEAMTAQLTDQGQWSFLLPLGLALVLLCLHLGVARRLATFYLVAAGGTFAAVAWGYWISPHDLDWHLRTSVTRTVDGVLLISGAATLHLAALLSRRDTDTVPAP